MAQDNAETEEDTAPPAAPPSERNVMAAAIAMKVGTSVLQSLVQKQLLGGASAKNAQKAAVVSGSALAKKAATMAAARIASRSVAGAAVVGAGFVAGALYKRGKSRRAERQASEASPENTDSAT